ITWIQRSSLMNQINLDSDYLPQEKGIWCLVKNLNFRIGVLTVIYKSKRVTGNKNYAES
ncbi:18109_t:CDS:1, partial [Acaulospora morrowiae]